MPVVNRDTFDLNKFQRFANDYIHYDVNRLMEVYLGMGAIGYVYRMKYWPKDIAVKIVPVSAKKLMQGKDIKTIEIAAKREAENIQKLNGKSDYLVKYIQNTEVNRVTDNDTGETLGFDYVSYMELLEPVKDLTLTMEDVDRLALHVCEAVVAIHKEHIMHRDIGPKNIFYDREKDIYKLGDYDFAKFTESMNALSFGGDKETKAPEVNGVNDYTYTADIYSLGKTLEILYAQANASAGGSEGDVYKGREKIREIIQKATEIDPKKRYQKAEEMLKALQAALR